MTVTAGPKPLQGWAELVIGLLLLVGLGSADAPGRLLLVVGAGALLVLAARDLLLRPTLLADADGLSVVSGLHRRAVPWSEVEGLRVVTDRRAPLLEIDLGATVVVLSRSRLGAPPSAVLEELEPLRPR